MSRDVDVGESFISRAALVELSGVVERSAEEIPRLLRRLDRDHGKTIIMVTHDPKAASFASRIAHLDKGALADAPLEPVA